MTNLSQFTINVRQSHCQLQCTLQLVCENRVLFVWVMRAAASEMRASNSSRVSTFWKLRASSNPTNRSVLISLVFSCVAACNSPNFLPSDCFFSCDCCTILGKRRLIQATIYLGAWRLADLQLKSRDVQKHSATTHKFVTQKVLPVECREMNLSLVRVK
jgi:hypothetical protein